MNDASLKSQQSDNSQCGPVRVMLVDDSLVARSIISTILKRSSEIEILVEASDTESALSALDEYEVDIILLDIEMPKRSGLDALPELLEKSGGASVLIVSSFAEENGPAAIEALSLGACDTLAKPGRTAFSGTFSQSLLEKVVHLVRSKGSELRQGEIESNKDAPELEQPIDIVAIGASTGGIPAIFEIVGSLDPDFDLPILITQHLPDAFMSFFSQQLARYTKRVVVIAKNNMKIQSNHIYIASGHGHIGCKLKAGSHYLSTPDEYDGSKYCPSVDAMLLSVAEMFGDKALTIILSGMGQDGLLGARKIASEKGRIIVQDTESSVVWGMPGSIVRENLATAIMKPADIGDALNRLGGAKR